MLLAATTVLPPRLAMDRICVGLGTRRQGGRGWCAGLIVRCDGLSRKTYVARNVNPTDRRFLLDAVPYERRVGIGIVRLEVDVVVGSPPEFGAA